VFSNAGRKAFHVVSAFQPRHHASPGVPPRGFGDATRHLGSFFNQQVEVFTGAGAKRPQHAPGAIFRCNQGPDQDGALLVADWGRGLIYRISYGDPPAVPAFDLQKMSSQELIKLLGHPNVWWRRQAQRVLNEKFDVAYAYQPLHHNLGHAFHRVPLYLDYDRDKGFDYPLIPIAVNCYGSQVIARRGGAGQGGEIELDHVTFVNPASVILFARCSSTGKFATDRGR